LLTETSEARKLEDEVIAAARAMACAAEDVKAEEIRLFDLRGRCAYTDCVLFASGSSDRQVRAIAENVRKKASECGLKILGMEGVQQGHWVLLDCGDVLVHIFYAPARMYYDLETMWADCPMIDFSTG
jgi:ribosome-associated protein